MKNTPYYGPTPNPTSVFDNFGRLKTNATTIGTSANLVPGMGFEYHYNAANQREWASDGTTTWDYAYDDLGQLTSAQRKWLDTGTPAVAGQQFGYHYDNLGNRQYDERDGRRVEYQVAADNRLNEATAVDGRFVNVIGEGAADGTVQVNRQVVTDAERHGTYFRKELSSYNTQPLWLGVTNLVTKRVSGTDHVAIEKGSLFVPSVYVKYNYDDDGNLLNDGRWLYTWDIENRLQSMETTDVAVAGKVPKQKITFAYDWMGRRLRREVQTADANGNYGAAEVTKFVYDGWNLVAELDGSNNRQRTYYWGKDLSGSLQGAGGIGGLVAMKVWTVGNAGTYFYIYDGRGNVTGLIKASDGTVAAQYEYGPFGELIRATGPLANDNPFRFSTKYQEADSGLLYYGYRYYSPELGRWLSRDPIGEKGGLNIFGFVRNDPVDDVDPFGLTNQPGDFGWEMYAFSIPAGISLYTPGIDMTCQSGQFSPEVANKLSEQLLSPNNNSNPNEQDNGYQNPVMRAGSGSGYVYFLSKPENPEAAFFMDGLTAPHFWGTSLHRMMAEFNVQQAAVVFAGEAVVARIAFVSGVSSLHPLVRCAKQYEQAAALAADSGSLTFYRGTTYYDALETVQNGAFDAAGLAKAQASRSYAPGLYLTSQEATAGYYADLAGLQGRAGGPAVLQVTVPQSQFGALMQKCGIQLESPIVRPPFPGQTETLIPPSAIEEFNTMMKVSHH